MHICFSVFFLKKFLFQFFETTKLTQVRKGKRNPSTVFFFFLVFQGGIGHGALPLQVSNLRPHMHPFLRGRGYAMNPSTIKVTKNTKL